MGKITKSTRLESYDKLERETIHKRIIDILQAAAEPLTAREISERMYSSHYITYPVRQAVAPRLTELAEEGIVKVCSKKYDRQTGRNVATYKLVEVRR